MSSDALNEVRAKVIIALGTMRKRGIPTEVPIGRDEGLSREGVVSAADLYTIAREAFLRRAGRLSERKLEILRNALDLALGLPSRAEE